MFDMTVSKASKLSKKKLCAMIHKKKPSHKELVKILKDTTKGKKSPVKKSPVKKSPVKKSPVKKSPVKKSPVKKKEEKKIQKEVDKLLDVVKEKRKEAEKKFPKKDFSKPKTPKKVKKSLKKKSTPKKVKKSEFQKSKCMTYTEEEIKTFIKHLKVPYNEDREELCKDLELAAQSFKEKCENLPKEKIQEQCRLNGLSDEGTRKEMCARIVSRKIKQQGKKKGSSCSKAGNVKYYLPCINKKSKLGDNIKPHQEAIVNHMLHHRGLIVSHSVGSGKTLSAVTAIDCVLKNDKKIEKIIIITPKSLEENMKKEFDAYCGKEDLCTRSDDPRIKFYTMRKFAMEYQKKIKHGLKNTFLIIDEAHNLRSQINEKKESQASRIITECAKKAGKVLLLTATPVINSCSDIANLIEMVAPEKQEKMNEFRKEIKRQEQQQKIQKEKKEAITHKDFKPKELRDYFGCMISFFNCVDKSEYPEVHDVQYDAQYEEKHDIENIMKGDELKEYNKVEKGTSKIYGKDVNIKAFYNGARRAVNDLDGEYSPKINWIIKKIQEENAKNPNNKCVIYSSFLASGQQLLTNRLDELGLDYAVINGSLSKKERSEAQRKYNIRPEDGGIPILLISKTGGEGLDLKETRHLFILEPFWNDALMAQVKGRVARFRSHIHLPPNERKVDIWSLYSVKPKGKGESADSLLKRFSEEKKEWLDAFTKQLKSVSIEEKDC
jgi:superfamily II DNA or RNA helicase